MGKDEPLGLADGSANCTAQDVYGTAVNSLLTDSARVTSIIDRVAFNTEIKAFCYNK